MTSSISHNRVADQAAEQRDLPVADAVSTGDTGRAKLDALEALKRRLHEDVANLQKTDSDRTPYGGDFESLVTAAQLASQQETDELLRRRLEHRLAEIEKVSRRVEQGQYGVCESCGSEIPAERLAAVPDTTLCVRCQSNRERRGGARRAA